MSKHKHNTGKKFKFSKHQEIGSPDAETDKLLMEAFVQNDALKSLLDSNNQRSIIIGRTGSGKSALLKYLENTEDRVTRIEPEAMSLRYLSNSNILQYFKSLDVNLNFFYKVLWKHVFIVELLKLYFGEEVQRKQNILEALRDKLFSQGSKQKAKREQALDYLKNWSKDFWEKTEHRIKELEKNIETRFSAETGIGIKDFAKVGYGLEAEERARVLTEVKTKAEKVINDSQADEIFQIIGIMREELFVDSQRKHFVIIDDLDKEWITSDVRYDLIAAMIEVIKEFQVFEGAKIIISLRDNLYQLVFSGSKHKGGQREKFKPLYVNLEWSQRELKVLLEKRLEIVSKNNLSVQTAFDHVYSRGGTGFDYMIERTFYRPRDVISYVNHAIENADNKTHFSLDVIHKAEIPYSIDRLQAIEDEWGENYGNIEEIYKFLRGKYNGFRLQNIKEDEFEDVYLCEAPEKQFRGELLTYVQKWKNDEIKFPAFRKEIIFLLFAMGVIGIKRSANYPVQFFFDKDATISPNDINNECKIYVHKAFYSALRINTKELEQESY